MTVTEIIDLDFRISIVHSLYVKVKTLLSLVNVPKFENFGENKFERFSESESSPSDSSYKIDGI